MVMQGIVVLSVISNVICAAGHGTLVSPPPRTAFYVKGAVEGIAGTCAGGMCYWFNEGCSIGCDYCSENGQTCGKLGNSTLPDYARTYKYRSDPHSDQQQEECGQSPWCSPGKAAVRSPCGVAGGSDQHNPHGNSGYVPKGVKFNTDARTLPELSGVKTTWRAGDVVNMSWSINANHGGGYQYRMCKKSVTPTEECFQALPMKFASKTQYIEYCTQTVHIPQKCCGSEKGSAECKQAYEPCSGKSVSFAAVDVSEGTTPAGSTWRRNPIPACKGGAGGCCGQTCGKTAGASSSDYQFPPVGRDESRHGEYSPVYGTYAWLGGFGDGGGCDDPPAESTYFSFNVVDEVVVPDVPAGDYIMSWRWDVEQGDQIWSTCADVDVEAPAPAPSPGPSPAGCPGGSLKNCMELCPSDPAAFRACVEVCDERCKTAAVV